MTLVLATRNRGKVAELGDLLSVFSGLHILSLVDSGIEVEAAETGATFSANARLKSEYYSARTRHWVLAEDSGLEVFSLNGRPGVHSARYAGADADDQMNINLLLDEMRGIKNRDARYVAVFSLARAGEEIASFSGEVSGLLSEERYGANGFGYDPVFYHPPSGRTFAQLTLAEKNGISHRAIAARRFILYLKEWNVQIKTD